MATVITDEHHGTREIAQSPFYRDHVYPHLVGMLGNPKPVQKIASTSFP